MPGKSYALARAEMVETLVAYEGYTTSDGAVGGTTLIDSALIGANDYISTKAILIMDGVCEGEDKAAVSFNNVNGTITVPAFSAQIVAGTRFRVLNISSVELDVITLLAEVAAIKALTDPKVMGKSQIAATTIDLDQAAGTYDLLTGTTQAVILESLNIKMPTGDAGGALTSISIQTDDVTPGVIISAADGAVANLTSEADIGWIGTLYITVGTKIQLTIAGGAHGAAYVCQVTAKCRAVVSGGYLA